MKKSIKKKLLIGFVVVSWVMAMWYFLPNVITNKLLG